MILENIEKVRKKNKKKDSCFVYLYIYSMTKHSKLIILQEGGMI